MANVTVSLQYIGYGLAGIAYIVLAILLLTSFSGRLRSGLLVAAVLVSVVWATTMAWDAASVGMNSLQLFLVEMIHDGIWIVYLSALLAGAVGAGRLWIVRYGGIFLVGGLLAVGIGYEINARYNVLAPNSSSVLIFGSILTALYALVVIEQIYRNSRKSQRDGLKYLCLGVGGIFAFDLFVYSNAVLSGQISDLFWGARGYAVALCVPLIAVAAKRSPVWSVGIFVSRQIVFYTATLFGAGIYLTVVGFSGYYIRSVGGTWGPIAQVVFFFAAIIALFVFLFSDKFRARTKVFIAKHFFENKYEYREEWLRLISTLTSSENSLPLKKRAIKALAQILEASSGVLWLQYGEFQGYRCAAGWNVNSVENTMDSNEKLIRFLAESGWIVELNEFAMDPSHYGNIDPKVEQLGLPNPDYILPLFHQSKLLGFVVLSVPATARGLNFEDRDLLKTAGQQIASYLAQEIATEELSEGRQFEAFNRLTAYLMHDLKNVIAQQSLVLENVQKHRDNPEFVDDVFETIRGSVARMRRIIEHLHQSPPDKYSENVELGKLIMQAVSQCADRRPVPRARVGDLRVWVRADHDRLLMALNHAIRNAQDATDSNGVVTVELDANGTLCCVRVIDNGAGMDEKFVRDRLFKPFDSTKGTQGMGIGAYQIRETVRSMGGEISVESEINQGTRLTLELRQESQAVKN